MKGILKKIISSITIFFSLIIDREAKRVNEFNAHILGPE